MSSVPDDSWTLCADAFVGRIPCEAERGCGGQIEELVRLQCQHAPAVSEHPEAARLYGEVSALKTVASHVH